MNWTFRQAMTWMHTWLGLVLGFVLMVVFFFGSLSVFDRKIDRWAIPQTRFAPQPMPSFDQVLRPLMRQIEPSPVEYAAKMPLLHDPAKGPMTPREALPIDEFWAYTTHRDPVLLVGADFSVPLPRDPGAHNHIHARATIDPRDGAFLKDDQLKVGSAFFYPLHYSLHLKWKNVGYFVVGLAAFIMLAALVSGVVIHRRLFREFFTFRPWKSLGRSTLDLHNLSGVAALPFHFFFAFTGLVIFAGIYFPVSHTQLNPLHELHEKLEAQETGMPHDRSGVAAPLASVDAMVAEAQRRWANRGMAGEVGFLALLNIFFYLDQRRITLSLSVVFLLSNTAFTLLSQYLGPEYYGYGFASSMLLTNLATIFVGMGLYFGFLGLTQFVQLPRSVAGYGFSSSVLHASVVFLLPGALAGFVTATASGRFIDRFGARPVLMTGAAAGVVGFTALALWHSAPWQVIVAGVATNA